MFTSMFKHIPTCDEDLFLRLETQKLINEMEALLVDVERALAA